MLHRKGGITVRSIMNRFSHPRSMVARGTAVAIILGMTGGHWAILQSVAWMRMIVVYSRAAPIRTALEQTFDGQHPCKMCKLIQTEKQASQQQPQLRQTVEKDDGMYCERQAPTVVDARRSWIPSARDPAPLSRSDPPPVPPPRAPAFS